MRSGEDVLAAMRYCDELDAVLHDRVESYISSSEFDPNASPLLSHVGILDINKALEGMGPDGQQYLKELYLLEGAWPMYILRLEAEQQLVARKERFRDNRPSQGSVNQAPELDWRSLNHLQNSFYPVEADGFIGKMAATKLWGRILGVPQLGWDKDFPLTNEHSRGSHSLFAAVNVARVLQALHDQSPDRLVRRLRADFSSEGLIDGSEPDEDIVQLGVELAVVLAMAHDVYTPCGGDMMKHVTGLDEEAEIENLLANKHEEPEAEFLQVLYDHDLEEKHVRFVVDSVQGRSNSLIGQMIHSEEGDILEQDRLAYTVQDSFSAGILDAALPRRFFEKKGAIDETALLSYYQQARNVLTDPQTWAIGPIGTELRRPSLTMLDVTEDYILDDNLSLVCTRPDKLLWLASFRAMMSAEYYQGAKLRGQEYDTSRLISDLRREGGFEDMFSRQNLLRSNNYDLEQQMFESGEPRLLRLLKELNTVIHSHMYESHLVDDPSSYDDSWLKVLIKIKPGLDTLVSDSGETMSLGEYARQNQNTLAAYLLTSILEEFDGKTRVIRRV